MFLTAVNAENMEMNKVQNKQTAEWGPVPATARNYKAAGVKWCVIGDDNYGECDVEGGSWALVRGYSDYQIDDLLQH